MKKNITSLKFISVGVIRSFLLIIIFINVVTMFNSCKGKPIVTNFQTTTQSQWNGQTITGTVNNLSSSRISSIAVEFELVNDKYMVLQTVSASSNDGIEPKGKWDFEIQASMVGARSARLKNTIAR